MTQKPWEAAGVSKATWYRRQKAGQPAEAVPPPDTSPLLARVLALTEERDGLLRQVADALVENTALRARAEAAEARLAELPPRGPKVPEANIPHPASQVPTATKMPGVAGWRQDRPAPGSMLKGKK